MRRAAPTVEGDGTGDRAGDGAGHVAGHPRRAVVLVLPALAVLAVLAWALVCAVQARAHLLDARAGLESLSVGEVEDLADLEARVVRARDDAVAARDLMLQPAPALLARVPLLGNTLAAERDAARAAATVLETAGRALPLARGVALAGGAADVEVMARLADELEQGAADTRAADALLAGADLALTPAAVGEAVTSAREALSGLDAELDRAAGLVRTARGLLGADGPRTVLVAVMNNAELRGAGGYASSIAVVRTDGGRVQVSPLADTNDVDDPPEDARRVPAPADVQRRYGGYLADTTVWKNVLMSADGPSSAATACEVAKVAPGVACDAVVLIDVPAVARLVELGGPVELPGGERVEGDELVRSLLVDAYAGVEDSEQEARRAGLRAAADAALGDLLGSELAGADALRVLADATRGRHVQVWSAVAKEQRVLEQAGAAGSADPEGDDLGLVVLNQLSASKLDYYVDREVSLSAVVGREQATVTQEVTLSMDYPDGLSAYVTGSREGRLVGLLELAVAQDAVVREVLRDGLPVEHTLDTDTGSQRVVLTADVANRVPATWTVVYDVPVADGAYRVRLLPQPLVRDARLRLSVTAADGLALAGGPVSREEPFARSEVVEVRAG